MSAKPFKRKWPVKSFTRKELQAYNNNGLSLYYSDPDRVDFGEMMFWRASQYIPLWITPNFMTRCGLFFNTCIFLISFLIEPTINGELGATAAQYLPSFICIVMAILQMTVSALDNFDGLHARGTNQCSDLGALLDHYFDSISTAMNSVAMVLLVNPSSNLVCGLASIGGPLIFHTQLLTNHYLKEEPRVAGPEAQFLCTALDIIAAVMFYYRMFFVLDIAQWICVAICAILLVKYMFYFIPKFFANDRCLMQFVMFCVGVIVILGVYWTNWISTFEMCICCVFLSWDYNGQIVTHDILRMELPIFKPWYCVIPIGVVCEYYFFNPLLYLVDSKNNIHLTTLLFWVVFAYRNVTHHMYMARKLLAKNKKKQKKAKNNNGLSG